MSGELRYRAAGLLGHGILASLMSTARWDLTGEEHHRPFIEHGQNVVYTVWHGRMIPAAYYHRHMDMAALISQSEDGEYIARVVRRWGYVPVRGSSSRGAGIGLRNLLRQARAGRSIVFTPDGPRGPRQTMKPGALIAARMTGLPVIPVSAGASRAFWFESGWDRFMVPAPFARIVIGYGAPHVVPRDADEAEVEARARALEQAMNDLTRTVDERAGTRRPDPDRR